MIFVTVGTHHQPFERLLSALDQLDGDELVVQYGAGEPPFGVAHAAAFMPFDEMLVHFRDAEAVVTHAGVGSILCATREGHVPVVVPRRSSLDEHVDDHQCELTRALAERSKVAPLWDTSELAATVAALPPRHPSPSENSAALSASVRDALTGEKALPRAGRRR